MTRALLIGLVLALGACGGNAPIPDDVFYRLPVAEPNAQAPLTSGAIRVRVLPGSGLYRDRAVLFSQGADYEIRRHRYHYWADSPADLVQEALSDYLRASGAAPLVLEAAGGSAEYEVAGRVTAFERRVSGSSATAHVAIELRMDRTSDENPVLIKEYTEDASAGSGQVSDSVAAFGAATGAIFDRFLEDARSALSQSP